MSLRITAGVFKGRILKAPAGMRTRPTHARLRQAIFNQLQGRTDGARVLDVFAGSGAIGFEALSRGAEQTVFVEVDRAVVRLIEENAKTLDCEEQITIVSGAFEKLCDRIASLGPFDLVFADPPYEKGWEKKLLEAFDWTVLVKSDGRVYLESSSRTEIELNVAGLRLLEKRLYGDSALHIYERN